MYNTEDVEKVTLCGANSYTEKYYLNPMFESLPEQVRQELQIMCVLHVEDVGGIITLDFLADGTLTIEVSKEDADYFFDEIDSELKIRRLQNEKKELLKGLEKYYRFVILKQDPADWEDDEE